MLLICTLIPLLIFMIFFSCGKEVDWSSSSSSIFECGFTSYFFSRFSFSIHYFLIGLIFLFLDLELCLLMPMMQFGFKSFIMPSMIYIFMLILIWGLLKEWEEGKIEWMS